MGYLESILALLVGFFKSIPYFDRWFTKTPTEKVDEIKKDLQEEQNEFKESGRPKW